MYLMGTCQIQYNMNMFQLILFCIFSCISTFFVTAVQQRTRSILLSQRRQQKELRKLTFYKDESARNSNYPFTGFIYFLILLGLQKPRRRTHFRNKWNILSKRTWLLFVCDLDKLSLYLIPFNEQMPFPAREFLHK